MLKQCPLCEARYMSDGDHCRKCTNELAKEPGPQVDRAAALKDRIRKAGQANADTFPGTPRKRCGCSKAR